MTLGTFAGMVVLAASGVLPALSAILLACAVLVGSRAIRFGRAVEALDVDVLIVVAAAIGLGNVVTASGLTALLSSGIETSATAAGPLAALTLVAVGTILLTEVLTNVAAAAVMLPIALDTAQRIGAKPTGFAVAVAMAASASFLSPSFLSPVGLSDQRHRLRAGRLPVRRLLAAGVATRHLDPGDDPRGRAGRLGLAPIASGAGARAGTCTGAATARRGREVCRSERQSDFAASLATS